MHELAPLDKKEAAKLSHAIITLRQDVLSLNLSLLSSSEL